MKTTIESILIPTDFSNLSESALKVGIAIAGRQHATILLLHVIDTYAYLQPSEVFLPEVRILPDIKSHAENRLTEFFEKINADPGISYEPLVEEGSPSDVICRLAAQKEVSLIVMGTHGISGLRRFFIGSESFRVIKNSFAPVLTIPGHWQKTDFSKVIFPVRIAPGIVGKYFQARPIIEKNNSEVFVLGLVDQHNPEEMREVTAQIDEVKAQMFADKVILHTEVRRSDDFPKTIIDAAIEFEADLLILSSNIDHNMKTFFLGPFAQQVVNHSHLPVLSIKPVSLKESAAPDPRGSGGADFSVDLSGLKL